MTYSDSMEIIALKRELKAERERRIVAEATAEANGADYQALRELVGIPEAYPPPDTWSLAHHLELTELRRQRDSGL